MFLGRAILVSLFRPFSSQSTQRVSGRRIAQRTRSSSVHVYPTYSRMWRAHAGGGYARVHMLARMMVALAREHTPVTLALSSFSTWYAPRNLTSVPRTAAHLHWALKLVAKPISNLRRRTFFSSNVATSVAADVKL
ncbi:hypothetical protein C8Q79DRAFT_580761 [Trametes meyenii]|nr:hypothetical protein C8Q79DRAFT_580761 [Trametes meyenii]